MSKAHSRVFVIGGLVGSPEERFRSMPLELKLSLCADSSLYAAAPLLIFAYTTKVDAGVTETILSRKPTLFRAPCKIVFVAPNIPQCLSCTEHYIDAQFRAELSPMCDYRQHIFSLPIDIIQSTGIISGQTVNSCKISRRTRQNISMNI